MGQALQVGPTCHRKISNINENLDEFQSNSIIHPKLDQLNEGLPKGGKILQKFGDVFQGIGNISTNFEEKNMYGLL